MKQRINAIIIVATLIVSANATLSAQSVSALETGDYSCGTYGGGNYSEGTSCSNNNNIKPPNTGFAGQLTEPSTLIPLAGSVLVLGLGVGVLTRKRRRSTHLTKKYVD